MTTPTPEAEELRPGYCFWCGSWDSSKPKLCYNCGYEIGSYPPEIESLIQSHTAKAVEAFAAEVLTHSKHMDDFVNVAMEAVDVKAIQQTLAKLQEGEK